MFLEQQCLPLEQCPPPLITILNILGPFMTLIFKFENLTIRVNFYGSLGNRFFINTELLEKII